MPAFQRRRRTAFALLAAWFAVGSVGAEDAAQGLVPRPETARTLPGEGFALDAATGVYFAGGEAAKAEAELLAAQLRLPTGLSLPVAPERAVAGDAILLSLRPDLAGELGEEGYRLDIGRGARVTAATAAGLFYGGQTLRQLLPPEAFAGRPAAGVRWVLPGIAVQDRPKHPWRGFMLDYARHFFGVAYTKHLLDEMAARKMNVFHMHLTDDDGWRIEIRKYPRLTEVGAWRGSKCALPSLRKNEAVERYGGFFTQGQIKEIVAYAAARHIEVVPEIDMPGHALAWVTAYPETLPTKLSDARNDNGFGNNLLSPAKEANYRMVDDILGEMAELFPSKHVHIGGDEVDYWFWDNCPQIQALVKREKLKGTSELQGYFTRRVEALLAKRGKRLVGWNEIADDRLPRRALIMSWTGAAAMQEALGKGFHVVAAHSPDLAEDMLYPRPGDEPPVPGFAGPVSFQRQVAAEPEGEAPRRMANRILGVEGCLWAEYVAPWQSRTGWLTLESHEAAADFKIFPRLSALADLGWSRRGEDPADAALRPVEGAPLWSGLSADLARLRAAGVAFRVPTPDVERGSDGLLRITAPCRWAEVRYTTDGTDPLRSPSAIVWDGGAVAVRPSRFCARAFVGGVPGPLCFGARAGIVGQWATGEIKSGWQRREVDLSGLMEGAGTWHLRLKTVNGKHRMELGHVDLMVSGKLAAQDDGGGGNSCALELERPLAPGDKVTAVADCRVLCGDEEPDSFGYILLDKVDGLTPGMTVSTTIPAVSDDYAADVLEDFDPHSHFWSNRPARKGESILFTFDDPERISRVEAVTGVPGTLGNDQLADGILEISEDGVRFERVASFEKGAAKAEFSRRGVRAVRITVTADQVKSWLSVQSLTVK